MSATPKSMWTAVKAMLHSVYDQPTADDAHAQFDRTLDYVAEKLPAAAEPLDGARSRMRVLRNTEGEVNTDMIMAGSA